MVERRANVIGHTAVHRNILANARQRFQNAHGIQRHAGVCHQAATWLHHNARLLQLVVRAEVAHGAYGAFGKFIDARRTIVGRVSNAQAAAHIQLLRYKAVLLLHAQHELRHDLHRFAKRRKRENLGANMAMKTQQTHVFRGQNIAHAVEREIVFHSEAELGVLATRADVFVRIGLYTRRYAHEHILHLAQARRNFVHARKLNATIQHNATDPCGNGFFQLARRFIVAVHNHVFHGEAHRLSARQLAATGNIQAQALLVHNAQHFLVAKRL